jgi:long-chain acyl-CoA synthetase
MLARTRPAPTATFSADSLAVLQYTGGTTGVMKAAMLSHRNLLCNVEQIANSMGEDFPGAGAVMVAPLPLYHIYAFNLNFVMSLLRGHQALLIPNPRDVDAFIAVLGRVKMRGFVGINTLYSSLLDNPGFRQLDFTTLALAASGGMPLSPQVAAAWHELTGKPILEGYGLTECSPMVSCNTHRYHRAGTAGRIAAGTEVRLFASDGSEVACGGLGEICVRGPQVMQGYWQRPDETAKVMDAEGWLRTGDIALVTPEGYLRIVDRKKDMIVVSGFNVYPNEIEDVVAAHPGVLECAAVGVPDERAGEAVRVFVVRRDPALTETSLREHCRANLTGYKMPKQFVFRDSLPKTNVGKILRRELRDS